jgi:hypothetical protein
VHAFLDFKGFDGIPVTSLEEINRADVVLKAHFACDLKVFLVKFKWLARLKISL